MRPHRNYPHQPVGWGTFTEAPPPVIAPYVEARPADWLLLAVLRPALGSPPPHSLFFLLAGGHVWGGGPRARSLARSHVRRRWALACSHAELASRNDRVPWVLRCVLTRAGEQLRVRLPAGAQVSDLENACERLAAFLRLREVRGAPHPSTAA